MWKVNLLPQEIKFLKFLGYSKGEIMQINEAIPKTKFIMYSYGIKRSISERKARKILGNKKFMLGLSKSAFQLAPIRVFRNKLDKENNKYIIFDSSNFFKKAV